MQNLRAMHEDDIDAVVNIIDSHDDDDAIDARKGYEASGGLQDQYVLEHEGRILGVTGYATPPGCEQTHWLSWTYIHEDDVNQGHGRKMISELIEHLRSNGARKLFLKISDYSETNEDGTNECVYAAADHLYKDLGFTEEVILKNYYDKGETMTILGMRLIEKEIADVNTPVPGPEKHKIQFNSIFEIAETEDAYSFGWTEKGKKMFDSSDVQLGLDEVRSREGRAVFLSFPHTYHGIADTLYSAGFSNAGSLEDYFEDGLHEQHFSCHL